jgi:hypothetical protein
MKDLPAFPVFHVSNGEPEPETMGLTVRDWFATFAPRPEQWRIDQEMKYDRNRNPHNDPPPKPRLRSRAEVIADLRYEYADAMVRARNGKS